MKSRALSTKILLCQVFFQSHHASYQPISFPIYPWLLIDTLCFAEPTVKINWSVQFYSEVNDFTPITCPSYLLGFSITGEYFYLNYLIFFSYIIFINLSMEQDYFYKEVQNRVWNNQRMHIHASPANKKDITYWTLTK